MVMVALNTASTDAGASIGAAALAEELLVEFVDAVLLAF